MSRGLGFQSQVNVQPAPAVEGDFATANPRGTVIAGPGGLVAGEFGVTVARFAWWQAAPNDPNGTPTVVNSFGAGPPTGFVHREQQGLITAYLDTASMIIPEGFQVVLHSFGDFWVKNNGATQALLGQKAYANLADGSISFAATGAPATGGSATGSIAPETLAITGSINDNVLTVTAVGSGLVVPGAVLAGTGIPSGLKVVSQIDGTANGVGTYYVSQGELVIASEAITGTYGLFTAASGLTGDFGVGDVISGSGVTSGTVITGFGPDTDGGLGTYYVSPTQTAGSTTISAVSNVETKYIAMSEGQPGELVKISSQALG